MKNRIEIPEALRMLAGLKAEAQQKFASLSEKQLNWKPSAKEWSAGQVMEHIIISNELYDDMLDRLAKGTYSAGWGAKVGFMRKFFGNMLVEGLKPGKTGNMQSPPPFRPVKSNIPPDIFKKYLDSQDKLIRLLEPLAKKDAAHTYVSSPAGAFIGYSLLDLSTIFVVHQQRHFLQIERIIRTPGFPSA